MSSLAQDLKTFRQWAWDTSPAFGTQIDQIYLQGAGFGDASFQDILDALVAGVANAAATAGLSAKDYFDANTQVNLMAAANRAGVPVAQYTGPQTAANQLNALLGNQTGKPGSASTLMIVALGAFALFMFMETEKTSRHIGRRK